MLKSKNGKSEAARAKERTRRRAPEMSSTPAPRVGELVRELILDHAEQLFAERGFFGASVRDITERAGVRLAAVNYHFGTKEEIFRDVLLRRARVLSAVRMERLAEVPKGGDRETRIGAIVEAFISPLFERASEEGYRDYFALIAQVSNSRLWALTLVMDEFNPVALAFVGALRDVFPRAPEPAVQHAYQFLLAATLSALADNCRLESLTRGELSSRDFAAIRRDLVHFATAGLMATCAGTSPKSHSVLR